MAFIYESSLKEKARKLRKNATKTEKLIWNKLGYRKVLGYKFIRQFPIDHFIVDFFCKELMLAIEIDGTSHDNKLEYDIFRESIIKDLGVFILRFTNEEVLNDIDLVVDEIKDVINELLDCD